jgi:mono/diheme cytochrome c family protein
MARIFPIAAGMVLALVGGAQGAVARHSGKAAKPAHYQQPADTVPAALADDQGQIVVGNCAACHSLDYITTQPRGKGTQFWRDEVTKMVNVYKAPVTPVDADAVVTVLDRKFGGNS